MSEKTQAPQDLDPDQDLENEEPNVTPEEQAMYDTVVAKGMELLYSEDRIGGLVEKLKAGADNISEAIGHSAAMTMTTLNRTAESSGKQIPEDILFNAGAEIVSQIVDIAVAAGIVSPEQEQDVAEAALYEGLRAWGQNMGREGKITDERALEAKEALSMAGIEQDISKAPGRQQEAPAPEGGAVAAAESAPAAQPQPTAAMGPAGPGIINQATGA